MVFIKILKTPLLKCIKLQDSNAFSVKLNIFSLKYLKFVHFGKSSKLTFKFSHLDIIRKK
jgi:hypothetical protein